MAQGAQAGQALSLYQHWVVDCSVKVNAAVKAARGLDVSQISGRTAAEAELSRLSIAVYEKLNRLPDLVRELGVDEVFGPRNHPLTNEQKRLAKL